MTRRPFISSSSNERLKAVRRLRARRHREATGLFVAEGQRQLRRALEAEASVREVYACPALYLSPADAALVERAERRGARVVELSAAAFESVAGQARPDGVLAVVERPETRLADLPLGRAPLVLVAEAVERPGNLGTIVRSACGAGATGLVVADGRTDVFHPETVRGSVGTIFDLPLAEAPSALALPWLQGRGLRLVVATPSASVPYWEAELAEPAALVVGNERTGVSDAWLDAADEAVAIPMPGPADSLNVAVAAAVVLFEAARQRAGRAAARAAGPAELAAT